MLGPSNLPPIESSPIWESMLLEKPLYGAVLFALIGGVAWWVLTTRGKPRPGLGALIGGLALAGGVMALGMAVETPREAASERSIAFIDAIVAEDAAKVDAMLAPNAIMLASGQGGSRLTRGALVTAVSNLNGEITSNAMSVKGASIASNGDVTVRFSCSSNVQTAGSTTVRSVWEADWREGASGQWWLTRLDCLWISFADPNAWLGWALNFANRG